MIFQFSLPMTQLAKSPLLLYNAILIFSPRTVATALGGKKDNFSGDSTVNFSCNEYCSQCILCVANVDALILFRCISDCKKSILGLNRFPCYFKCLLSTTLLDQASPRLFHSDAGLIKPKQLSMATNAARAQTLLVDLRGQ